jgi:glycerophosphoryl diester phosphodiesterase
MNFKSITLKLPLFCAIILLTSCTTVSISQPPLKAPAHRPEVHGHRGARWVRPENTLPALGYALDAGADVLELDLGVTKDNVLVIYHDQFLNPDFCQYKDGSEIKSKLAIHSLTLKQIKQFDCGTKQNPRFKEQVPVPGTEIPTLEEFFNLVAKHPRGALVKFNIETKSEAEFPELQPEPQKFASLAIECIKKNQVLNRSILQSFDFRTLVEAKKIEPKLKTSALVEFRPKESLKAVAEKIHADIISPDHEWLTKQDVSELHAAGIQVIPWTANTVEAWKKLVEFQVDGIITDNPRALIEYLGK